MAGKQITEFRAQKYVFRGNFQVNALIIKKEAINMPVNNVGNAGINGLQNRKSG